MDQTGNPEGIKKRGIRENVDGAEQHNSVNHRAWEFGSGIDDFITEEKRCVPAVKRKNDSLKHQYPCQNKRYTGRNDRSISAWCGDLVREHERAENKRKEHEGGDRAGDVLKPAAPPDATSLDHHH